MERDEDSAFGRLLRRHRIASNLSQEALAERARMSAVGIGALERGARRGIVARPCGGRGALCLPLGFTAQRFGFEFQALLAGQHFGDAAARVGQCRELLLIRRLERFARIFHAIERRLRLCAEDRHQATPEAHDFSFDPGSMRVTTAVPLLPGAVTSSSRREAFDSSVRARPRPAAPWAITLPTISLTPSAPLSTII